MFFCLFEHRSLVSTIRKIMGVGWGGEKSRKEKKSKKSFKKIFVQGRKKFLRHLGGGGTEKIRARRKIPTPPPSFF